MTSSSICAALRIADPRAPGLLTVPDSMKFEWRRSAMHGVLSLALEANVQEHLTEPDWMAKKRMTALTMLRLSCVQKEKADRLRRLEAVRGEMSDSPAAPKSLTAGGDVFCMSGIGGL